MLFWDLSHSIPNCLKHEKIIVSKSRFWKSSFGKKIRSRGNSLYRSRKFVENTKIAIVRKWLLSPQTEEKFPNHVIGSTKMKPHVLLTVDSKKWLKKNTSVFNREPLWGWDRGGTIKIVWKIPKSELSENRKIFALTLK